jgi:pimeloyl-ACP methyl ester carboxylesterase
MVLVPYHGSTVDIEYCWLYPERRSAPLMVFLHEGLGSVSSWRDFPQRLCDKIGFRGLVYSRPGYGRSTPGPVGQRWSPSFLHEQALEVLPAVMRALCVDARAEPPWLLGHSDGGSIALIYAAVFPRCAAALVLLAPHIFVEDVTIASIEVIRKAYFGTDLREKLARHHADPDAAFLGWNDRWLNPGFRRWNIEPLLPNIACPVLAAQGLDDEYGTVKQIEGIVRGVPRTEVLLLEDCGHSPHREQPAALIRSVTDYVARHSLDESWTMSMSTS